MSGTADIVQFKQDKQYSELAVNKIDDELKMFIGGLKEKAVSKFVASTITHFCKENERFAEAVYKTQRTLSDCCAEVMEGSGNQISDIDVYRGAVRHYFPNADISFKMEILIYGEDPTEEELTRKPTKRVPSSKTKKKGTDEENEEDIEVNETEENIHIPKKEKSKSERPKKDKLKENKKQELMQISIFESLTWEE